MVVTAEKKVCYIGKYKKIRAVVGQFPHSDNSCLFMSVPVNPSMLVLAKYLSAKHKNHINQLKP